MRRWLPARACFEPEALEYPLGRELYRHLAREGVTPTVMGPGHRVPDFPSGTPGQLYREAKRTLVVGIQRRPQFRPCRPSADYEFALVTGCPGLCQYCYLQGTLGRRPYVRVWVNLEEILEAVRNAVRERLPRQTSFEVSSTADPMAVEHLTGSLHEAVRCFAATAGARLRLVTKFPPAPGLLELAHGGRTDFRVSVNAPSLIRRFEPGTSSLEERVAAAVRVAQAGYRPGFLVAPLMVSSGWEEDYRELFRLLGRAFPGAAAAGLELEFVTYRFTAATRKLVLERWPRGNLDLEPATREYRRGRYGRGKYVYPARTMTSLREHLARLHQEYLPRATWRYFV